MTGAYPARGHAAGNRLGPLDAEMCLGSQIPLETLQWQEGGRGFRVRTARPEGAYACPSSSGVWREREHHQSTGTHQLRAGAMRLRW